jgi:hypothetical protein
MAQTPKSRPIGILDDAAAVIFTVPGTLEFRVQG